MHIFLIFTHIRVESSPLCRRSPTPRGFLTRQDANKIPSWQVSQNCQLSMPTDFWWLGGFIYTVWAAFVAAFPQMKLLPVGKTLRKPGCLCQRETGVGLESMRLPPEQTCQVQSHLCWSASELPAFFDNLGGAHVQFGGKEFKLLQRHGAAKEVALVQIAAEAGKKLPLSFGFNALGHHGKAHGPA